MNRFYLVVICLAVSVLILSGNASSALTNIGTSQLLRVAATTTTLPPSNAIKCEGVNEQANEKTCLTGACPEGMNCVYRSGTQTAAAYVPPQCLCERTTTTTTLPQEVRCEKVVDANEKTCMAGICSVNSECAYVPVPGAVGYCKCKGPETTTTTLPRCERIQNPNDKACMSGLCPDGTRCVYRKASETAVAFVPAACVCEKPSTTTTIPSEVRCEKVVDANEKTCMEGICPDKYECKYGQIAGAPGYCRCAPKETTTTTLQYTWCEKLTNPSERECLTGMCPPNTVCRYSASASQPASFASAAANPPGRCRCVPCEGASTTSTTLPRCERIQNPDDKTCMIGACPDGSRCVYKPAPPTAAVNVPALCVCEKTPPTTIPPELRCEAEKSPEEKTCAEDRCLEGYDCKYVQTAGATGNCKCLPKETTTTIPSGEKCETISTAGQQQCIPGACPEGLKCSYVPSATGANTGYCKCAEEEVTTTTQPAYCEEITNVNEATCVSGKCPDGTKCTYAKATFGNQAIAKCVCAKETTSTTAVPKVQGQEGILARILRIFGI